MSGGGPGSRRETKLRCGPPPSVGGVKRKAALGTSKAFSRSAVTMLAVAVMPGRNF